MLLLAVAAAVSAAAAADAAAADAVAAATAAAARNPLPYISRPVPPLDARPSPPVALPFTTPSLDMLMDSDKC